MTNIMMVDLETLDTKVTALVLSIGYCIFDKDAVDPTFTTGKKNLQIVNQAGSLSDSTFRWWLQQSEEARKSLCEGSVTHVVSALNWLNEAYYTAQAQEIWSYGASFDIAILEHMYDKYSCIVPWSYRSSRCFRTIRELYPDVAAPEFKGAQHDAEADALHQAKHLWKILNFLRSGVVM